MQLSPSILVLLLAACSGGSRSFSPSQDLRATHEYLRGSWQGTLSDGGDGTQRTITAYIGEGARPAYFDVSATIDGVGEATGDVQADGDRWHLAVSSSSVGSLQLQGVVLDRPPTGSFQLGGTWRGQGGGALGGRSGTLLLRQVAAPAVVCVQDVFELEGLTLVVQRHFR